MNEINEREIALEIEAENERLEMEKIKPLPINKKPVDESKIVWMVGTIVMDVVTAYFIWQTTVLIYGIWWVLIGAGGLIWSERQRGRIGNNDEQKKIGSTGVVVSAVAVLVMALGMGAAYLTHMTEVRWVMLSVEIVTVGLCGYHLIQAYRYHELDDEYQEQNADSIAEARNVSELRQIHRAARRVESKKRKWITSAAYRGKHGEAFDAALKSITPSKPKQQQGNQNQPMNAPAQDVEAARLSDKQGANPRNGSGQDGSRSR